MLRQILPRGFNGFLKLHRTYLSNSFKAVVNRRLDFSNSERVDLQYLLSAKEANAISLNYLSGLSSDEGRQVDIRYLLLQLRTTDQASKVLESTYHLIIRHFVENGNALEFLPILLDRANYGIFLNNVTACYLMDHLLQEKYYMEAAQTAVVSIVFDNLDNDLVHALAIKSCYEYLNEFAKNLKVTVNTDSKEKVIEKKIRVKFLQNSNNSFMDINKNLIPLIGKTLKIADKSSKDITFNTEILGLALCKKYTEMAEKAKSEPYLFHKDIANICIALIHDEEVAAEFLSILKKQKDMNLKIEAFDKKMTLFINKTVQSQEAILIAKQQEMYDKWVDGRKNCLSMEFKAKTTNLRMNKIDSILAELNKKKQQLWYFSSEDKFELEIYLNRTTFPKKWFGKKKNPKVVDDFYIPPDI